MKSIVPNPDCIRLAMLGMVDGNGHPYSWSAIINGRYDAQVMADCGFPVIPQYLGAEPPENLGIPGVQVTHVWCDDPAERGQSGPSVLHSPRRPAPRRRDRSGRCRDYRHRRGWEHVDRARPFIEAGLPLFIDKPLCDREEDLRQFIAWHAEGKRPSSRPVACAMQRSLRRRGSEWRRPSASCG